LIVEDDPEQASVLIDGLRECGMDVAHEAGFHSGISRALTERFDVLILDVLLPGGSGFALCARLRAQHAMTRVLMLTAKDTVEDRVHGLDVGADDYLTKPFAFRELVARVRALARRPENALPDVVTIGDLRVDFRTRQVSRAGQPLLLTQTEYSLLEILVRRAGHVLDREAISLHIWGDDFNPFTNVIEVLVGRLRRKVDDGQSVKLIHTMRGSGYRLAVGE
jgi:two-component system copper resistance phosphate regulon response regulator CusR